MDRDRDKPTMRLLGALRHATGRVAFEKMPDEDWAEAERLAVSLYKLIRNHRSQAKMHRYQK